MGKGICGFRSLFQSPHFRLLFSYSAMKLLGERKPAFRAKRILGNSEKGDKGKGEELCDCILIAKANSSSDTFPEKL